MNKTFEIECMECNNKSNSKLLKPELMKAEINNEVYNIVCFNCSNCNKLSIVSIDNEITSKVLKELDKNNLKLQTYKSNNCTITKNMLSQNTKLRLKLNLLRGVLYRKLDNQDYQLLDNESNIIQTGIIKLPKLISDVKGDAKC